ncbi:calcitonin gene-related peptide type 1 receptor-like [Diorhabda sublineata]|uniref:calcitonin gene-related peptide type 1 receptor-like n=1 Tax=Diorhabda sublineata TaxID=1163346 RepID=UPI0024E102B1|nr:calcitonin gene-related peptide type 1 receptor-like [Diorhabda sublineata]
MDLNSLQDLQGYLNTSKLYFECGLGNTTPGYCPEVFDTNLYYMADTEICWPETAPGTIVNRSCPEVAGLDRSQLMFKECLSNGSWYIKSVNGTSIPYVDYTRCINLDELEFLTFMNKLSVIGYSVSLAALLISLTIFLTFRTLKCTRIRIHTQLFISFILNNVLWIIWYEEVVPFYEVPVANPLWCQILHVSKEYFMVANYMWMFCEGLHLHMALVVVFVREERTMRWFFGLGWGVPVLIIILHNSIRFFYTRDTRRCWLEESSFSHWFLSIPVLIILGVCTVFLINVLRVILTIMHPNSQNPAPIGIRRATRAALILIPLFGIQYILLPMIPEQHHPLYHFYQWLTLIMVPFQGLCCSCLFCFANQDVIQAIKNLINGFRQRNARFGSYRYTGGAVDSAGVYVVNGSHRKSTVSTKI